MTIKKFKTILLITLTTLCIYYLLLTSFNLLIRLTATIQPSCNPLFCEKISEDQSCVIKTPGADKCLEVGGIFYVPSIYLAYSLLLACLGISFYFSNRFYLSRILLVLIFFVAVLSAVRIILGAIDLSLEGAISELNKMGLYQPFFKEAGESIFMMINPKL